MTDVDLTHAARDTASPFFIMGCPRSGTTLVAQLLDNHPRIAVFVESMYYPLFLPDLHRYGDLRRERNFRRLIRNFQKMVRVHGLYRVEPPSSEEIRAAIRVPTFEAVLVAFLELYARRQGKARCGEKTARHHEYLSEIAKRHPQSPIVFLMRDPRDVALSIREMFDARLETGVAWWNAAFRSWEQTGKASHVVRYEELVRAPGEHLARLCDFLDEEYDPAMLGFSEHLPQRLREAPHHRKLSATVDDSSVGRFRGMSGAEIAYVEAACADGMEALGYAPSGMGASSFFPTRERLTALQSAQDIIRRFRRRSHVLAWKRRKMRLEVRAHYLLTLGPLRDRT